MPVMNGFECTRRIKRAERDIGRRHTPIVGVTGRAMPSELELCFEAGMDDVLVKPYLISDLWEVVVRWCRRAACDSGTF
jgi:CheY-like chemotaxis protein